MVLEDYNCILCSLTTEAFTMACWGSLGLVPSHHGDPFGAVVPFRNQLHMPFFMEVIISMCWAI